MDLFFSQVDIMTLFMKYISDKYCEPSYRFTHKILVNYKTIKT